MLLLIKSALESNGPPQIPAVEFSNPMKLNKYSGSGASNSSSVKRGHIIPGLPVCQTLIIVLSHSAVT